MKAFHRNLLPVLALGTIALSGCSQTATPAAPSIKESVDMTAKGGTRHNEVTIRAIVESIDVKDRTVKLKGFDGSRETIHVGEDVKNLAQVKRGDTVVATYYKSVAFEVVDPKQVKLGSTGVAGLATAEPGTKPAAAEGAAVVIVADILKIDRANQTVQLKTEKGDIYTVDVERPEVFEKIKVGNRVAIKLTEAVAIEVHSAE